MVMTIRSSHVRIDNRLGGFSVDTAIVRSGKIEHLVQHVVVVKVLNRTL